MAINRENASDVLDQQESVGDGASPAPVERAPTVHKSIGWDVRSGGVTPVSIELPAPPPTDERSALFESQGDAPKSRWRAVLSSSVAALRVPASKRLGPVTEPEPIWKRYTMLAAALGLTALHFFLIITFWSPGHSCTSPGNNQNGYLVGARNLALYGNTGFEPKGPFEFVGWMWVMADGNSTAPGGGVHHPKYPIGLPLVDAIVYRIGLAVHGEATAVRWVFFVSPMSMSLAMLGTFFIGRLLGSSFVGLLGMILLATCPLALILANNPNSHALALFFIIWGFYFLLRWWQSGYWLLGLLAGFMLGYAVTIRYTEGLLLVPLALAGLTVITYRGVRDVSWWRAAVWVAFVALALVLNDSIHGRMFDWQRAIEAKIGSELTWWHRAILVIGPVLLTIRWRSIDRIFARDTLLAGEWARTLACAAFVLAASWVNISHLQTNTPGVLHAGRLLLLLGAFCGAVLLIYAMEWRLPRTWLPATAPAVGWLLPVLGLVIFNQLTHGSLTGYDSTNESTGFTWNTFMSKWGDTADQLYDKGLYFVLPLGLLGILLGFRWNWRAALMLLLWFLPGTLLYMAYYYGRGMPLIGYLRFFTSMLPPVVIGAVWLMHRASVSAVAPREGGVQGYVRSLRWWQQGSLAAPIAAALFVAFPAAVNLNNYIGVLERDFTIATNLQDTSTHVRESVPNGSVIFGNSQRTLNYLQFALADMTFYGSDYFQGTSPVPPIGSPDPGQPNPIQAARRQFLRKALGGMDSNDFVRIQNQIMTDSLTAGKRVFVVMDNAGQAAFKRRFMPSSKFETRTVRKWTEPARMSTAAVRTLSTLGADMGGRSSPQGWSIVEVKLKSRPATEPASTAPTTQP